MTQSGDRPLLTFALVSCNQEPFVREAVEAAFAQTYSPLQIILSDDCSDDRSFEIMREMAEAYRGPHQITLNRNPARKIMGGHMNRVLELTRGELIVIAAADDVSLPNRTEVVHETWEKSGRQATSIFSDLIQIDEAGKRINRLFNFEDEQPAAGERIVEQKGNPLSYLRTLKPTVHGCSHAICPRLYRRFGRLPEQVVYEDKVLAFRSVLLGKVYYINEPLVRYRLHGANLYKYLSGDQAPVNLSSLEQFEARLLTGYKNRAVMYAAFLHDLHTAREMGPAAGADYNDMVNEAGRLENRLSLMNQYLESGLLAKYRILPPLLRTGLDRSERKLLLSRLAPAWLYLRLRLARNQLSCAWRRKRPDWRSEKGPASSLNEP
jgi:glycosyltransferase involved in cell wall biosynthesis